MLENIYKILCSDKNNKPQTSIKNKLLWAGSDVKV